MQEVIEIDDDYAFQDAKFQLVENKPRRFVSYSRKINNNNKTLKPSRFFALTLQPK